MTSTHFTLSTAPILDSWDRSKSAWAVARSFLLASGPWITRSLLEFYAFCTEENRFIGSC